MTDEAQRVREKWRAPEAGSRYATTRFAGRRAAQRDPRRIEALLARHGVQGPILDAPCGAGRLHDTLLRFGVPLVELDGSESMLAVARAERASLHVLGSIAALPFRDRSFDVVVACRFLHHLHEPAAFERAVAELVRVSKRLLVASFWDASSLPALRVRLGWKRSEGPRGRSAVRRSLVEQSVERAGAEIVEFRSGLRFVSQQTFFVARRG